MERVSVVARARCRAGRLHAVIALGRHLRQLVGLLGGRGRGVHGRRRPSPLIEQWDGSTWSAVHAPSMSGILFSVTCTGPSSCWAAGTTLTDDNQSDPLNGFIDHWDGSSWTKASTAPSGQTYDQFNSVTCSGPSDCWAVGFAGPNQQNNNFLPNVAPNVAGDQALVERWNGAHWTKVTLPAATSPDGTYLSSVTCASSTECWSVGATMGADGNPSTTLVERWNGAEWATVSSPSPAGPHDLLTDVTCLGPLSCWAVGASGTATATTEISSPTPSSRSGTVRLGRSTPAPT